MPAGIPPSARSRRRGRPRSESARRAVLDAARTLFARGGYPAATIEGIAARSGVAKTTIYRWWANRSALLVDLLLESSTKVAAPAGRDPLRALRAELQRFARAGDALPGRLLQSLLGEALRDLELRAALQQGLFHPRHSAAADVIRRAQGRGMLRRGVPPPVALDLLYGALFYRRFIRQEPITPGYLEQVFEWGLAGLGPGRTGARSVRPKRASARPATGRRVATRRRTSRATKRATRRTVNADGRTRR